MTDTPSHRRGAAVTQKLLDATLEELAAHGPSDLRVEAIAARAGLNKSTVYRRFPTLPDLIAAALEQHANAPLTPADTGTLHGDLYGLARSVRDSIKSTPGRALLMTMTPRDDEPAEASGLRGAYWGQLTRTNRAIITRATERGECPTSLRADDLLEQLISPIHFRAMVRGSHLADEELISLVSRCVRSFCTPPRWG